MRIAVIGAAGKMGRHYVRLLQDDHDVTEVEIGQSVDDAARESDAVIIASPTAAHFNHAVTCLAHGTPILIEKPITFSIEQAISLVATSQVQRIPIAVGYLERFNPIVEEVAGDIGRSAAFTMVRMSPDVSIQYGPVSIDLASHDLDLLRFLYGGHASLSIQKKQDENDVCMYLVELTGSLGNVYARRGASRPVRRWLITHPDGKEVTADLINQTVTRDDREVVMSKVNQLQEQLAAFFDLIKGRPSKIATAADGLAALQLAAGGTQQ